ncbi:AMP-binding protein [Marmoricola sp. RAF53]|uniref:AMP-binding protein n=1 Tax=Marmoricola sp. RAF53 TaxID=3233059 RepID=UPI003F9D866B
MRRSEQADEPRIDAYLPRAAMAYPDRLALVDGRRRWTYTELDAEVRRWAGVLAARGIGAGDVVSWQLPNWGEAVVLHQAVLRIGAVSNPIVPIYRHSEVSFILRQARSKILFVPGVFRGFDFAAMASELADSAPDLRSVVIVRPDGPLDSSQVALDDFLADGPPLSSDGTTARGDGVALLLYTSGTTSSPKGVLHTHATLDHENRSIIEFFGLSPEDVVFMPSPVTHITGLLYGMQLPFMLGASVVLLDVWEPAAGLASIEQHGCTFTVAATPFLHGMLEHPGRTAAMTKSMRVFACGGADVPPELVRRATAEFGCMVSRIYGSTEFPTATSSNASDSLDARACTDGRPIGQAEVRVVDADGTEVQAGTVGLLLVRGPELFLGYLDSELDAAAFTPDRWFVTGDLAVRDDDGYVRIAGREKDIIVRGGENISAKEIEDLLFEHPKVADVAVVAMPDPVLVERVCVFIVTAAGADVELAELTTWLRGRRIANQKLPERLVLTTELPRTASGKVQKFKLRERLRQRAEPAGPDTSSRMGSDI